MNKRTVLIAGGGASGALVAANLLRSAADTRVVVIEPAARLGRGMAYSTQCPLHLLNVPAAKMSAYPDDPMHFVRWLEMQGLTPEPANYNEWSFVPRMIFGDYVESALMRASVEAASGSRLEHVQDQAVGCVIRNDRAHLELARGRSISGEALVLALGNAAPAPWPNLDSEVASSGRFFGLTWEPGALIPNDHAEAVLLLGTGLTAVDAALALRHNGHRGPIHMVSRRGLLPQGHRLCDASPIPCAELTSARELSRFVRVAARHSESVHGNWRPAVDGVRPRANALWQGLTAADQRRFLRHLRPYWDAHRHRMAPQIAQSIHELMRAGLLNCYAGRVGKLELSGSSIIVPVVLRGGSAAKRLAVARVINCTGPECDLQRTSNPLMQALVRQGELTPHPLRMGALVDGSGALIGRGGMPSRHLYAMGPLRMGTLIESVAIPEIRQQASDLAACLTVSPSQSRTKRELVAV